MKRFAVLLILLLAAVLLAPVQPTLHAQDDTPPPCAQIRGLGAEECLVVNVLNEYPHDADAFTQGLLWNGETLYESTGQYGQSTLREVALESGDVIRREALDEEYFAEGLELVNGQLIQLTWREGQAFVYDAETFEQVDTYTYEGEGWGLCYDDRYLYMSDSTNRLSVRDAQTFDLIVQMAVTFRDQVIGQQLLNELECVGDYVYANLWQTNYIVQIDKYTGEILHWIDATTLLSPDQRATLAPGAVLNGIAYNPDSETFYVTGKDWPALFEVTFEPAASD